jgi:quinol monooxygenase YgiN
MHDIPVQSRYYINYQKMKKSEKVVLLAEIHVLPGYEKEIFSAAEKQWASTTKEKGNEAYILTTEKDNDSVIRFFEIFSDVAAFDAHAKEIHTKQFGEALKGKVKNDNAKLTFLHQYEPDIE